MQMTQHSPWDAVPQPLKSHIIRFLNGREIVAISSASKEFYTQKTRYLCNSLRENPQQIQSRADFTHIIAQLLQKSPTEIHTKNHFEIAFLEFIYRIAPEQVEFLKEDLLIEEAGYGLLQQDEIVLMYSFTETQVLSIAKVLEQFFENLKSIIFRVDDKGYYLSFNKDPFLKQVIPAMFCKEMRLVRQCVVQEPEINKESIFTIDYFKNFEKNQNKVNIIRLPDGNIDLRDFNDDERREVIKRLLPEITTLPDTHPELFSQRGLRKR